MSSARGAREAERRGREGGREMVPSAKWEVLQRSKESAGGHGF